MDIISIQQKVFLSGRCAYGSREKDKWANDVIFGTMGYWWATLESWEEVWQSEGTEEHARRGPRVPGNDSHAGHHSSWCALSLCQCWMIECGNILLVIKVWWDMINGIERVSVCIQSTMESILCHLLVTLCNCIHQTWQGQDEVEKYTKTFYTIIHLGILEAKYPMTYMYRNNMHLRYIMNNYFLNGNRNLKPFLRKVVRTFKSHPQCHISCSCYLMQERKQ